MTVLRSLAFNVLALAWTVAVMVAWAPLLAGPRRWTAAGMRVWAAGIEALLAGVVGLRYEVRGRENLPRGGGMVASNHQSAWETVMFARFLDAPAFILKRELLRLPTGWYAWRAGSIPINRGGGAGTLRVMVAAAERALRRGQTIVIFPQGTRIAPGVRRRFRPGIAALYGRLGVPVVPIALNSGLYWSRRAFLKRPGTVLVEVLPPIPPGLDRTAFMARLTETIEVALDRLTAEATERILEQNVNGRSS
ncbi:MAG: lysophospholipid acyltransferase family protein [Alphaproteobacteria bacterium]